MQVLRRRVPQVAIAGLAVAAALSGCSLVDAITPPVKAAIYTTAAEAKASDAPVPVPAWMPDDATMIRIKTNTKTGDTIMQFTAASQLIGGACDATMAERLPPMQDTWWHQTLPTPENISCFENWHIFVLNGEFNAWTP